MNETGENAGNAGRSLWADAWRRLRRDWIAMMSLGVIIVFVLTAAYGGLVYVRYNIANAAAPKAIEPLQKVAVVLLMAKNLQGKEAPYEATNVDRQYEQPSVDHVMGTDGLGRDVFMRVVQGARIAFMVGVVTSLIAIPLAVILGCLAGYFGGWVDDVVVWLYSTVASMPSLLFILSISLIVGKGLEGVYLGIGLTTWVGLCRLIRGEVMKHRELTYVRAATALGMSNGRTIFRHILPNVMHIVIVSFSMRFPTAIETEVIMSFLGIGVQDQPSWGILINNARFRLWHGVWWELVFTTAAILIVVLAFNMLGDALRDALDPRLKTGEEKKT